MVSLDRGSGSGRLHARGVGGEHGAIGREVDHHLGAEDRQPVLLLRHAHVPLAQRIHLDRLEP